MGNYRLFGIQTIREFSALFVSDFMVSIELSFINDILIELSCPNNDPGDLLLSASTE
jgi:hypothetical protein